MPGARSPRPPIVIGVAYQDAARIEAAYNAYGGKAEAADPEPALRAVAGHINATDGIGGRRLDLRLQRYDATNGTAFDTTMNVVCTSLVQEPRPVAVLAAAGANVLSDCLAAHDTPLLLDWPTTEGLDKLQRLSGHLFMPGSMAPDRFAAPYVRELRAAGFFRDARVGVLVYAHPTLEGAARALRHELAGAGVKPVADVTLATVHSWNDVASVVAEISNAIVRFRIARVDRVVSLDVGGQTLGLFMKAAEAHGYRPRYGLSSLNTPLDLRTSLPAEHLKGAVGIGWSPLVDVGADQEGAVPALRRECDAVFRDAHVDTGGRGAIGAFTVHSFCGSLLLLRSALADLPADAAGHVRAALERLGGRAASAIAPLTRLDSFRHDGAAVYRPLHFDSGCGCFRYTGPVRAIP